MTVGQLWVSLHGPAGSSSTYSTEEGSQDSAQVRRHGSRSTSIEDPL